MIEAIAPGTICVCKDGGPNYTKCTNPATIISAVGKPVCEHCNELVEICLEKFYALRVLGFRTETQLPLPRSRRN